MYGEQVCVYVPHCNGCRRGETFEYVLQHVGVTFSDWTVQDMVSMT
jgi:hypothetical protein